MRGVGDAAERREPEKRSEVKIKGGSDVRRGEQVAV